MKDESGVILLQTVMLALLLNLISFTLVSVSLRTIQVEQMHHTSREAYYIARSAANHLVVLLQSGQVPDSYTQAITPTENVTATITNGSPITVTVQGKTNGSMNAIRFTYDTELHKITSWLDSGQG